LIGLGIPERVETRIKTNLAPLRGRGLRGERLEARVPHGHWKTLTFIAALRHDRVDAPCVIDGLINGDMFTAEITRRPLGGRWCSISH
jgi:hypothetical protein